MSTDNVTATGLGDYLRVVRRHWLAIVLCLVLGAGAGLAYLQLAPKQYQSTAAVLVSQINDPTQQSADKNAQVNMDTEAQLVTATPSLSAAAAALHVPAADSTDLVDDVDVSVPPNSTILDITYTGGSADDAVRGAAAFAQAYLDQRNKAAANQLGDEDKALQARIDAVNGQLQKVIAADAGLAANSPARLGNDAQATSLSSQLSTLTAQQNQVRSTVVSGGVIIGKPSLPTSPSSPNTLIGLTGGIVLGLLIGLALAALRDKRDDRIRTPEDLSHQTGLRVTATLTGRLHDGEAGFGSLPSADRRVYGLLRNLVTTSVAASGRHFVSTSVTDGRRPVVLVAGVHHGGGPVAANLSVSLARSGAEVVLLCTDVFGTSFAGLLGDHQPVGLGEVLAGDVSASEALSDVPGVPTLRVLAPGRDPDRADELLQTRTVRPLVDELLSSADYVVIDGPAILGSVDTQSLSAIAPVALLVAEAGRTRAVEILDASSQLEAMATPVLGAVLVRYGRDRRALLARSQSPEFPAVAFSSEHDDTRDLPRARNAGSTAAVRPVGEAPDLDRPAEDRTALGETEPASRGGASR